MKNKTSNQGTLAFDFEEVPLEEAQNLVAAGSGNYADLKAVLLTKLPALAPDKAFVFGSPDGHELDEKTRRGLCTSVNHALKDQGVDWRVSYSGLKKQFICVPRNRKSKPIVVQDVRVRRVHGKEPLTAESFVELAKRVFNHPEDFAKNEKMEGRLQRKAICIVGVKDCDLAGKELAKYLGITHSGVAFNAYKTSPSNCQAQVNVLRNVLKGGRQ